MSDDALLVETHGPLLMMSLNRPDARNALNQALTIGLVKALDRLATDDTLRAGVLRSTSEGFCAGMDLKAFAESGPIVGLREMLRARTPKPVVAAVEKFAFGGGLELALMCDLVVAARGTKFALTEAKFGLLATGGGLFRIPEPLVTEMALTGLPITAERAAERGMVSRLVEPGETVAVATELASAIAGNAPLSIARTTQLVRARAGRSEHDLWQLMAPIRDEVFNSSDAKEGAAAFAEKRTPHWTGS
jgi:enoyl-CoA hydratase